MPIKSSTVIDLSRGYPLFKRPLIGYSWRCIVGFLRTIKIMPPAELPPDFDPGPSVTRLIVRETQELNRWKDVLLCVFGSVIMGLSIWTLRTVQETRDTVATQGGDLRVMNVKLQYAQETMTALQLQSQNMGIRLTNMEQRQLDAFRKQ